MPLDTKRSELDLGDGVSVVIETGFEPTRRGVSFTIKNSTASAFYAALSAADARRIGRALMHHAQRLHLPGSR